MDRLGNLVETGRVSKILAFRGLERAPIDVAEAGDIVAIAGLSKFNVADTLCSPEEVEPLQAQPIDPPTISMTFSVNDSPLAGTEGDKVTSRVIRDRLLREAEGNVALKVETGAKDAYVVSGRGELQLAILIEPCAAKASNSPSGARRCSTSERDRRAAGADRGSRDRRRRGVFRHCREKMSERKAELIEMRPSGGDRLRLVFLAPSRGLIGYHGEFLTDTRGTAIMNRFFHNYAPARAISPAAATAC